MGILFFYLENIINLYLNALQSTGGQIEKISLHPLLFPCLINA